MHSWNTRRHLLTCGKCDPAVPSAREQASLAYAHQFGDASIDNQRINNTTARVQYIRFIPQQPTIIDLLAHLPQTITPL